MSKIKLFFENFLVYGLGGIISKIIPLIMIPIITRLMPDASYFGISDLSNTLLSFCSSLAVMGMYDAMYRMFFEKEEEEYKRDICSTAFLFTLMTSVIIFCLMLIFKEPIAKWFFGDPELGFLVYITAVTTLIGATNSIISAPIRMQNKRKVFLLTNTISPVISYTVSIGMLLKGYYIVALPLAGFVSAATMQWMYIVLNHSWFDWRKFNKNYLKQLLSIALPLTPNFLIYWIFNSCDKLMIVNLLNTTASGIYSVGSKLGHASQLIYIAFSGGWQFFAFSTMKEENQVKSNSLIFEYLGLVSYGISMFVFALAQPIYRLLFTGDFVHGYMVSPYLFLAPLLLILFQVGSSQFLVIKRTWPNFLILSLGALANVLLNYLLIPKIGIEGAAIATLAGYAISDILVMIVLCKMNLMIVRKKFIAATILMFVYVLIWRRFFYDCIIVSFLAALVGIVILLLLYRKDVGKLFERSLAS